MDKADWKYRYEVRPNNVTAIQWKKNNLSELIELFEMKLVADGCYVGSDLKLELEGGGWYLYLIRGGEDCYISPRYYITRDVNGECSVYSPVMFEALYQRVIDHDDYADGIEIPIYCQGCLHQARNTKGVWCVLWEEFLQSDGVDYMRALVCVGVGSKDTGAVASSKMEPTMNGEVGSNEK